MAIKRAVKRAGARAKDAAVAISGDAAITKVIQMPRTLGDNELEGQVEMQADQYIPFLMEEASFDFEVIGPSEKKIPTCWTCCSSRRAPRMSSSVSRRVPQQV